MRALYIALQSYTTDQTQSLEKVHQRRALQTTVGDISYDSARRTLEYLSLNDRRREQCGSLFKQIVGDESHVLRYLLPTKTVSPHSQASICQNISVILCADKSF